MDPAKLRPPEWKQVLHVRGAQHNEGRDTAKDKILIVLEFLKADLKMDNLCRKHDVTPWRLLQAEDQVHQGREAVNRI